MIDEFVTKRDLEDFEEYIKEQLDIAIQQKIKEYCNSPEFEKDFLEGTIPLSATANHPGP